MSQPDRDGADRESRALLALAKQFRDAAAGAGRPDVVATIDEAILLLTGTETEDRGEEKTNVVLRILDGLGL